MRGFVVLVALLAGPSIANAKRIACPAPSAIALPIIVADPTDTVAPAAPVIEWVTAETRFAMVSGRREVTSFSFGAELSADTVLVRIELVDRTDHHETMMTTPQFRLLCPDGNDMPALAEGVAEVTITAIDRAGNESSASTRTYVAPPRHYACGGGILFALLLVAPVGAILLAILLFIRSAIRRRKLRQPGAPIAPLVAEAMTRAAIGDTLFTITWGCVLALMLYFSHEEVVAVFVGIVPVTRIIRLAFARRFLSLLERGTTAELHDNLLATNGSYILVADRIVKDALARSVPTASAKR